LASLRTWYWISFIFFFAQVDRITPDFNFPNTTFEHDKFRVVLSHIPLSFIQGIFSEAVSFNYNIHLDWLKKAFCQYLQVMAKLKPNLIFSAHDHRFAMATTHYKPFHITYQTSAIEDINHSLIIQRNLSDTECIEIRWPTCSYRMGVLHVGYGVVSIGNKQ